VKGSRNKARLLVLEAVGNPIFTTPDSDNVKLYTLFHKASQLADFIERLRMAIIKAGCSRLDNLETLTSTNTLGDVVEAVALLLSPTSPETKNIGKDGKASIRPGDSRNKGKTDINPLQRDVAFQTDISGVGPIPAVDPIAEVAVKTHTCVRVFYATDRKESVLTQGTSYSAQRSDNGHINYGECTITIPKTHKVGKLESTSIL